MSYVVYALCLLLSFPLLQLISREAKTYRKFLGASKHGCKRAPRYPNWDIFLGLDFWYEIQRQNKLGRQSAFFSELHRIHGGTFEARACSSPEIYTMDLENIQAMTSSNFESWGVEPERRGFGSPLFEDGIFSKDGVPWKESKSLIQPLFSKAELSDSTTFEEKVEVFIKLLPRDGRSFDIQPLLKRLFLDVASEFIFGKSFESLKPDNQEEGYKFMAAFDRSMWHVMRKMDLGPLGFLMGADRGFEPAYTTVHRYIDRLVEDVLAAQVNGKSTLTTRNYVLLDEMALKLHDRRQLRAQILNVFFAARDTSAILFTCALWELSRIPHYWNEIRKEALGLQSPISYSQASVLPKTKAVINEALRLHPNASIARRTALQDTILPVGGGSDGRSPLFVPKGRIAEIDMYSLQRDPRYWGDDATTFNPDRWMAKEKHTPGTFIPFLTGRRQCLGQVQAEQQLAYLMVRMAREFESIECRDEQFEFEELRFGLSQSKRGAQIALKPQ